MSDYKKTPFRPLLIVLGIITTVLGFMGIFVPGLPATPLLLLSSWLFYRSSEKLHNALHKSFLGDKIREYEKNKGLSIKGKLYAISLMLIMVTISITFFITNPTVKIIVICAAAVGTIVVGFVVPTVKINNQNNTQ
ncbi:MAG: YbaN family protein [Bacteroidales bacterium]|nr:YbaN family protein [Bacteroidales bacterium]